MVRIHNIGLLFVMLLAATFVHAQTPIEIEGVYYNIINETTVEVCVGDTHYSGDIAIPSTVHYNDVDYNVVSISANAFKDCTGLTSIRIPKSIKSIGNDAFYNCSSLAKAIFASVKDLCETEFGNFAANPLYISHHLFIGENEKTGIEVPVGVTEIKNFAFAGGKYITNFVLGASVNKIGKGVFKDCKNHQVVYDSFSQMLDMEYGDGDSNPMANANNVTLSTPTLEDNIYINQNVNAYAFKGAKWIKTVSFGNEVTSIGQYAFSGCPELSSVTLPTLLESIGQYAFSGCKKLTEISIPAPSAVENFGINVFDGCSSMENAIITAALVTLPEGMFLNCKSLTSVTLPQATQVIGKNTFKGCTSLTSLPLPAGGGTGLTTIKESAFYGCTGIKTLEIPGTVNVIEKNAFYNCDITNLIIREHQVQEPVVSLSILEDAFTFKPSGETSNFSCVKNIFSYADPAPQADPNAFGLVGDTKLFYNTSVDYTAGAWGSFTNKSNISGSQGTITYYIDNVKDRQITKNIGEVVDKYVPTRDGWFFSEWDTPEPERMSGDLDLHGYFTKEITDNNVKYLLSSYPQEARVIGYDNPVAVVINQSISYDNKTYSIVAIEDRAFKGATTLKSVDLSAANLTSVGKAIFADCSVLESIKFPAALTAISDNMFYGCSTLSATKNLEIPATVKTIGESAFRKSGIKGITLPAIITEMGDNVFRTCTNLEKVVFADEMQLSSLPQYTFDGCSKLESFTLPSSTTIIGKNAFSGCSSLKLLVLDHIVTICPYAFNNCSNLKAITLPVSIKYLQDNAFANCKKVEMITINSAKAPELGSTPFHTDIYTKASLYVKNVDEYTGKTIWKDFKDSEDNLHIYPIGGPHQLIYMINGNTQYGDPVPLATGKPIVLKEKLSDVEFTEERDVSDWECEYEIMPNTDVYVNCSLKYHLTYKNKVTGTEICSEDLFYGQDITDPNDLKKKGFTYEKEIVQPTETESITKMPASDVVYNVIYSLTQKPTAKNITYTGNEQELINAGSVDAEIGTITYSIDNSNFSTTIPKGTNAGDYIVYYKVDGITSSEQIPDVKIKRRAVTTPTITLGEYNDKYDGNKKEPGVTLTWYNTAIQSSEYKVSYENNINAGNAQVIITNNDEKENGNFTVSGSKTFQIKKAELVLANYLKSDGTPTAKDITYDGNEKGLINAGSLNTNTLELEYSLDKTNYFTTIPTGTDAGDYKVYYRIKGNDNYNSSNGADLTAKIKEKPITILPEDIILEDGYDYAYDGTAKKPDVVSVKYGDMTFTKGTHFTVSYSNNTNVGEATVTLTDKKGNGCNYEISGTKTFTILPERSKLTKLPTSKNNTYNGSDQDLINKDGTVENGKMQYSLSQDESSFSETVPKGKDAGSYTVYCKVKGDSNHSDSEISSVTATIAPREITAFALSASSYVYDGSEKKPTVTVTYSNLTVPSSEYNVSYTNNINAGTATVTLTDKEGGNFNIHGSKTFTITKAAGSLKQKPSGIASLTYNGNAQNLITAGSSETGTVEYSLDKTNYGTTIPVGINAKSYTVYYRVKGDANHKDANSGSVNVTIAKAPLTITAENLEIFEGEAIPEFSIRYDGFKNNETDAVLTTKPTVSCKATASSKAGEYTITVSGAKADNYNITHKNGKLVILAMKFVSGGETAKDEDDAATYQVTSTGSDGVATTPTVAITDDKEVSGSFAIPETVTYHSKTFTVTEIGESAFENNKNLTEVTIPSSITSIGDKAFKDCSNLKAITVYITTPISLAVAGTRGGTTRAVSASVFDGVNKTLCILYVPDGSVELYKAAPVWKEFLHIAPLSSNPTGISGVIKTEDEPFDIYNLQGQKVKSKVTSLEGLPRGIYIINGKKVAVK